VDSHQQAVLSRLKTARGQISGIVSAVEADAYCPEVMKQLSAVQGLLEGASRIMLRRHLETCVATAMQQGRTAEIVDELMETLKFDKHVFRPPQVTEPDLPAAGAPGQDGPDRVEGAREGMAMAGRGENGSG